MSGEPLLCVSEPTVDVEDLPLRLRSEIGHFVHIDRDLDRDRHSEVNGWADRAAALEAIDEARAAYRDDRAHADR